MAGMPAAARRRRATPRCRRSRRTRRRASCGPGAIICRTTETSTVMPRSLNDPVCELPHCLIHRSSTPRLRPKRSAHSRLRAALVHRHDAVVAELAGRPTPSCPRPPTRTATSSACSGRRTGASRRPADRSRSALDVVRDLEQVAARRASVERLCERVLAGTTGDAAEPGAVRHDGRRSVYTLLRGSARRASQSRTDRRPLQLRGAPAQLVRAHGRASDLAGGLGQKLQKNSKLTISDRGIRPVGRLHRAALRGSAQRRSVVPVLERRPTPCPALLYAEAPPSNSGLCCLARARRAPTARLRLNRLSRRRAAFLLVERRRGARATSGSTASVRGHDPGRGVDRGRRGGRFLRPCLDSGRGAVDVASGESPAATCRWTSHDLVVSGPGGRADRTGPAVAAAVPG